ncbi:MAG: hypothetical protein AAF438_01155 [Pseudomonadota bacterium]
MMGNNASFGLRLTGRLGAVAMSAGFTSIVGMALSLVKDAVH